jgi:PAT family beta-lactamase induction signal transducer AmpG
MVRRLAWINPRLVGIFFLGIASGLPLALTGSALQAWYSTAGVSLVAIGFLALLGQPYVYKFLWAPLFDRYIPPFLGRRAGWILITQCALVGTIAIMACFEPSTHPILLASLAFAVAICSASQDIAIDAYRTDVLPADERGMGAAYTTGGYRVGMLISGAIAFILADHLGWDTTYRLMAGCMLLSISVTFFLKESEVVAVPSSLYQAVMEPLQEFFQREYALLLLLIIISYKLTDAFAMSLSTPFLLQGVHFSLTDVGLVNKTVGIGASILGIFVGGGVMTRLGLFPALFYFGILQGLSNLLFMLLAWAGKSFVLLFIAVFGENFFSGMGTAALVALLMSLCDKRHSAAQFALFSAFAAVGRVFVGPVSGLLVVAVGWAHFYLISSLMALPGLLLLWWLPLKGQLVTQSISEV